MEHWFRNRLAGNYTVAAVMAATFYSLHQNTNILFELTRVPLLNILLRYKLAYIDYQNIFHRCKYTYRAGICIFIPLKNKIVAMETLPSYISIQGNYSKDCYE